MGFKGAKELLSTNHEFEKFYQNCYPNNPKDKDGNVIIEAGKIWHGYEIYVHPSYRGGTLAITIVAGQVVYARD